MTDQAPDSGSEEWCCSDTESYSDEEVEEGGMMLGNVVADRHGRQEAQGPVLGRQGSGSGLVQPPSFQFSSKCRQKLDGRPLLLFDINGVLMQHRWNGVSHQHDLRPGCPHLLRLLPYFRLGIYSSATRPTVTKALAKLHGNLANYVEQRRRVTAQHMQQAQQQQQQLLPSGGGDDVLPLDLPSVLFEVVMARDHCQPASREVIEARGGRPWDTVKPLRRYFGSLQQVVLVDDSAHKAAEGEGSNMLVVPCWHGLAHPLGCGDRVLPLLVDLLVQQAAPAVASAATASASAAAMAAAAPAVQDLRRLTATISAKLAEAAAQQLEDAQAGGLLNGDEALAAAAVLEAAISGSAAVAAAAAADGGEEMEVEGSPAEQQQLLLLQLGSEQPVTRQQKRERQEEAATLLVLAAAAAQQGGSAASAGSDGITLAEVNCHLNHAWAHLSLLLLNKTAKGNIASAAGADKALLQLVDGSVVAAAAAAGAAKPAGCGNKGKRYRLTVAGAEAAPSHQYIDELDAYCKQFADRTAFLAHLNACRQEQEQQQVQQPPAEGLFFWEQAVVAPKLQPPPGPAGTDLALLQEALVLHAVALLQPRRGISLEAAEKWVQEQLVRRWPGLLLFVDATTTKKLKPKVQRRLRQLLLRGMERCEQAGWGSVSRLGRDTPHSLLLFCPSPEAPPLSLAEVAAGLEVLVTVLVGAAPQPQPAAATSAAAEEEEAVVPAAATSVAAEAAAEPFAAPVAAPAAAAVAEPAAVDGETGAEPAAGAEAEPVPLLLAVIEDRAPATAQPGALAAQATAVPQRTAPVGTLAAAAAAAGAGADRLPAAEGAGTGTTKAALQGMQAVEEERQAVRQRLKRLVIQHGLSRAQRQRYLQLLEAAELTGQVVEELTALETAKLKAPVQKACRVAKKANLEAIWVVRQSATPATAEVLDCLFAAAAGGDKAAWAAACATLSKDEQAILAVQQVGLGEDRSQILIKGGGAAARSGKEEGEKHEEGVGKMEEAGAKEEDEGAAAASEDPAAVEAAVAAHGGHFLRSCDRPAVEAGAMEQQQQQQQLNWEAQQAQQQQWRLGGGSLSPLHYEVDSLATRATPTPTEVLAVQQAVLAVSEVASSLWPHARTALFGSQATGLALPGSDLDIVVLGVGAQLSRAASGFTPVQRKQLSELLEDLLDALLKRCLLAGQAQIIEARVPIIKCKLNFGGGLAADISLGAENGAQAVDFVRRQVLAVPPLRPLCLAVKAFLRERGTNEVFTGGISSYSVFNMVMAHLQLEGYRPDTSPAPSSPQQQHQGRGGRSHHYRQHPLPPADLHDTLGFLHQLAAGALPALSQAAESAAAGCSAQQQQQQRKRRRWQEEDDEEGEEVVEAAGRTKIKAKGPADLGVLLWSFFDRFGNHFSYAKQAVSIRMGGVCLKVRAWRKARRPWALAVEDPQEMGKDIGGGSSAIREIKESFAAAAEQLAEVCEDLDANEAAMAAAPAPGEQQQQQQQGKAVGPLPQRPGQGLLLAGVLDVEAAVGRGAEALRARMAMGARAAAKSQKLLHERIRCGMAVGRGGVVAAPKRPSAKQRAHLEKMERKAEKRQRRQEESEAYLAGQRRKGSASQRKLGSKRMQAVEAAWATGEGQYMDFGAKDDWSLQKQKKSKKKGKVAAGGGSIKKQKRQYQGERGSAKKKKARNG